MRLTGDIEGPARARAVVNQSNPIDGSAYTKLRVGCTGTRVCFDTEVVGGWRNSWNNERTVGRWQFKTPPWVGTKT